MHSAKSGFVNYAVMIPRFSILKCREKRLFLHLKAINLCLLLPQATTLVKNTSNYDRIGRKKIGIYPGSFWHQ